MFSKRTRYAIRLLFQLDQNEQRSYKTVEELSEQTNIPEPYLGKIVGSLAEIGFLETKKGPSGGARLAVDPGQLQVEKILSRLGELTPIEKRTNENPRRGGALESDEQFMSHCINTFREKVLGSLTLREATRMIQENGADNQDRKQIPA